MEQYDLFSMLENEPDETSKEFKGEDTKPVKEILLHFSDLNYIVIPGIYVDDLTIADIDDEIITPRRGFGRMYEVAGIIEFTLNKETNEKAFSFEGSLLRYGEETLFERIIGIYKGISEIGILYADDRYVHYRVKRNNKVQLTYLTEDGGLRVEVKSDEETKIEQNRE